MFKVNKYIIFAAVLTILFALANILYSRIYFEKVNLNIPSIKEIPNGTTVDIHISDNFSLFKKRLTYETLVLAGGIDDFLGFSCLLPISDNKVLYHTVQEKIIFDFDNKTVYIDKSNLYKDKYNLNKSQKNNCITRNLCSLRLKNGTILIIDSHDLFFNGKIILYKP